jgi:OOP family OmpA-OmpF porin
MEQDLSVQAWVTGTGLSRVVLHHRPHDPYSDKPYHLVEMTSTGGLYSAVIPAEFMTTSGVDYFLSAWDASLARTDRGTCDAPLLIRVNGVNHGFPKADAGPDRTGAAGQTIVLDGTGSLDPDPGDTLAYEWIQTGGPPVTLENRLTPTPSFVAPRVETDNRVLSFELAVTDPGCLLASDSVNITLYNDGPKASFTWDPAAPTTGNPVAFTDTSTAEVPITAWLWDFGGAGTSTQQHPSFTFSSKGTRTVTLTVTDQNGLTGTVSLPVTVLCSGEDCGSGGSGCFVGSLGQGPVFPWWIAVLAVASILAALLSGMRGLRAGRKGLFRRLAPVLTLAVIGTLFAAGPARSANLPGFTVSILGGGYAFDRDQDIDPGVVGGAALGYNLTDRLGIEGMIDYGRFEHDFYNDDICACDQDRVTGTLAHLGLLWHFRPQSQVVPYLAAGLGTMSLDYDRFKDTRDTVTALGGGVKLFLSDKLALRGDVRHIRTLDGDHQNVVLNLGLMLQFPFAKSSGQSALAAAEQPGAGPEPAADRVETQPLPTEVAPAKPAPATLPPPAPAPEPEKLALDLKILFDFDKTDIKPRYYGLLADLAQLLESHPETDLLIQGHTCSLGSEEYNRRLSVKRAESVKQYLVSRHGIAPARISTVGFGETLPEADNATRAGRAANRRALIVNMTR